MNPYTQSDIPRILYEDDHILVCVKPRGIATQSRRIGRPDMVNLLKNHIHQHASAKGEPYLAVIHRLDQPVTGILVFAKSPFAAGELNRQLTRQGFGKYYRALVEGCPPEGSGILEDYMIKDDRTNLSHICSRDTAGAKPARLRYSIVPDGQHFYHASDHTQGNICTELEILLDTGRHHQIRVQLAHIGCPIVGDTKYNPDLRPTGSSWQNICLCAFRLEFCHPRTGKLLQFRLDA